MEKIIRYKSKGITLIALIITIIVLLILAGVTIATLTGENGLLKNAQTAETKHSKAEAKEKLQLVLMELQTDKISKSEYNEQEYVNKILNENDMQVEGNVVTVDGWQFEIDRSLLKIIGEETQIPTDETISAADISNNPTRYYGKEVQYSTKSDTTIASIEKFNFVADIDEQLKNDGIKWKIFYSDEEHIYLIASDYVKVDGDNYYKVFDTDTETLAFMNNQSNWKDYVGNYAEYAVGGPTFTMFANSWNAKYPNNKITGATGSEESGWFIDYDFPIEDDMYSCSEHEDIDYGYWLASKSTIGEGRYLVHVEDKYGVVSYGYAYSPEYGGQEQNLRRIGFRPIVCLKSDVELQVTNGTLKIVGDEDETEETLVSQIKPTDYGKSINYTTTVKNSSGEDVTLSNWKVFYNDNKNVYIILDNYLDASLVPSRTGLTTDWYKYNVWSEKDRDTLLNGLTTTSYWSEFASGISGAIATGTPTAEMLMASYNAKYRSELDYTTYPTLDKSDTLYVLPQNTELGATNGYCLASPLTDKDDRLLIVHYHGLFSGYLFESEDFGVRPVVCLPAETTGTIGTNVEI